MQFVDVTNDIAFRKIFGQQEKKEVLISFLNAVITLPNNAIVEDVTIVNPYQLPLLAQGKTTILDVKAKDSVGNTFIVEMQVAQSKAFHKRVMYYTAQSYSQQIVEGDDYDKLFPVYFIGILNFPFDSSTHYYNTYKVQNVETHEQVFTDISFHIIELEKFTKKLRELKTIIDQWIYFIKNASDLSVIPENISDAGLHTAYEQANRGTWTPQELEEYLKSGMRRADEVNALKFAREQGVQEGLAKGEEIGLAKGEEKGVNKNNRLVIITGHKNGLSIAMVSTITNLSEEQVQIILNEEGLL
jgi:predicted transposase/invertase (TIGR01784 family)